MPRMMGSTCAVVSIGAVVAGCQTAPVRYADTGVHATYEAAASGAGVVKTAGGELYHGAGSAVRQPFHDLNLMQDKIAPVLLRAEDRPYDLAGVNSCQDVLNRVSELDLALGPDVDTPKERKRRMRRSADFAASAALDAAGSAAEHFIPMRSTIKQISGATRYENHVKHAVLAGTTRRSFLKAVGMAHNCTWPAAPLDFKPTQVAALDAAWTGGPASAAPPATLAAAAPVAVASAASRSPASAATYRAAALQTARASAPAAGGSPKVVLVSAATASRPGAPVFIPVYAQIALPSAAPPAAIAGQQWRPATPLKVMTVSDPVTTTASLETGARAPLSTPNAAATPWGSSFTSASARP